jgi:hypothetical protein
MTPDNDILETAKRVQHEAANDKSIHIRLSFLQDLIAEIERLRERLGDNR